MASWDHMAEESATKILGASRRPPTPNFRIFGFFEVFGPFSGFFEVGDSPGVSGNPFSCPEIDFSSKNQVLKISNFYKKCNLLINRHLLGDMHF